MPRRFRLHSRFRLAARALMCGLAAFALQHGARATMIISDTFTGPNNTALIGRLPSPDDTPGASYEGNGNVSLAGGFTGGTPYEADLQLNQARVGGDAGLALNLGISTPVRLDLSISFNISGDTETQANNAHRGAGLGFFSSVALGSGGSFHGFNNFTGLVVDSTGSVRLIIGGANSGIATTVAGFDPSVSHTLSYSVDTNAGIGSISNIFLDSTAVTLVAPADTFTTARTTLAGFYNSSGSASDLANFDDFSVALVPEPSTFAAVLGLFLLAGIKHLSAWRVVRRCAESQRNQTRTRPIRRSDPKKIS